ncbi:predicted protein [Histoplasma capsulatum var. duboisii H88]|uniref:Predicted protein n=2 Tax=Ajellomyces capsulatus TaxID=5037 RepID=F0UP04_AJEC8|nr:predicted protein [Histoplasma capsulatum H143]EGC47708.1 predicted protein [Histoplasma capsulatum var. duboisii H88]
MAYPQPMIGGFGSAAQFQARAVLRAQGMFIAPDPQIAIRHCATSSTINLSAQNSRIILATQRQSMKALAVFAVRNVVTGPWPDLAFVQPTSSKCSIFSLLRGSKDYGLILEKIIGTGVLGK